MAFTDLAINRNGNFVPNSRGGFGLVGGNNYVKQLIYAALVEMPPSTVIGSQFVSVLDIEDTIRRYLATTIISFLPFTIDALKVVVTRNRDESVATSVQFPNLNVGATDTNDINITFQGREGYQNQLDYNFSPDLSVISPSIQTVNETIIVTDTTNIIEISVEYSGIGPIRVYPSGTAPQVTTITASLPLVDQVRKYKVSDLFQDQTDIIIDSVTVLSNEAFIDKKLDTSNQLRAVSFEDGMAFIYLLPGIDFTQTISLRITYSNAHSFSQAVTEIIDDYGYYTFPLKLNRSKYKVILFNPLQPGAYDVVYQANVKYSGDYS